MNKLISSVKAFLSKFFYSNAPSLYYRLVYFHNRGKFPNLTNPQDISEIILAAMKSGKVKEFAKYVDKIEARKYIAKWVGEEYLPQLYGVWDSFDDVDFSAFPNKFALKTNHGCGNHFICVDKATMDMEKARNTINRALSYRYHNIPEKQYELIKPRIFCEEYIECPGMVLPLDYKFMCCDGEVKCILVCLERAKGLRVAFYDTNWEKLDYVRGPEKYESDVPRPTNLDKMLEIATKIASHFEYIRVDLYDTGTKVYVGELTFTPEGGKISYLNNRGAKACGHTRVSTKGMTQTDNSQLYDIQKNKNGGGKTRIFTFSENVFLHCLSAQSRKVA